MTVQEIANFLVDNAHGCRNVNIHHGKVEGGLIQKGCVMCWAEAIHKAMTQPHHVYDPHYMPPKKEFPVTVKVTRIEKGKPNE